MPQPLACMIALAISCISHLPVPSQELEECRAFELLKGQADRVNYLMTKQVGCGS